MIRRYPSEKDACAIVALIDKRGRATHANIINAIDALRKMGHRSGDINGEGDGCGIAVDIPREVWSRRLSTAGTSPYLVESRNFFVGHFLLGVAVREQAPEVIADIKHIFTARRAEPLAEMVGASRNEELGPRARSEAPLFWQIAGIIPDPGRQSLGGMLFAIQQEIEKRHPGVHIASLSPDLVVYKVQGVPELLPRVYPELLDAEARSVMALGHGRYSTNTLPTVERSQPFSTLGHNGEINTIERLRSVGRTLGITPVPGGSDSQDLNRLMEGLIHLFGLELIEAMEMVFPPVYTEVEQYGSEPRELYAFYRWFFPSSAQGPAAIVSRHDDVCMGAVDALGLRPLWFGESDYEYFLSSEKGVVPLEKTMSDPRPLAPGEKIAIVGGRGRRAEILDYTAIQKRLLQLMAAREGWKRSLAFLHAPPPEKSAGAGCEARPKPFVNPARAVESSHYDNVLAAFGWTRYDISIRQKVSRHGKEVIGSMGHTGPLAAFAPESLPNVADYFKEDVAVVTNPAIDREREMEHFNLRAILGCRPLLDTTPAVMPLGLELRSPLLLGGMGQASGFALDELHNLARHHAMVLLEDVVDFFSGNHCDPARVRVLDATFDVTERITTRIGALCDEAEEAVKSGALLVIMDDSGSFSEGRVFIDPALVLAAVNERLMDMGLRRRAGLVIRSGAMRNLHDIMVLLGLGADALNPYLLWHAAVTTPDCQEWRRSLTNTVNVLHKGMEKVMSTMGIHELCGYGRIFTSIGLARELSEIFRTPHFCPGGQPESEWARIEEMARERYARATDAVSRDIHRESPKNPRVGRILRSVAEGRKGWVEMAEELAVIDEEIPTAIRHVLAVRYAPADKRPALEEVDISIGGHDMPLVIAAMSFGSQGENSFRAYAEAAQRANIVCMNGEGGEIPDMLGRYRKNRGQQIASGRFGVFMGFLNSVDFLEIKIGQGAKPGEGGHLPGGKVSDMVAAARHCKPGITLISPSNHHDIYSIEDLAQIITELKTANPLAKVSVKIPITSNVGTIGVGIAKAGADIVNLSGFEGGTGAAREHAKRFVGLPAEIGVAEAHRALVMSGLRQGVELWVDGGMRSGLDVFKMILLGADRAGFGTAALMGIGCISCRQCHLDRCPRGITTQARTGEEAESKGIKGFKPREMEREAANLTRLLRALGDELRMHLAGVGETSLRNLVGRVDLLEQYRLHDRIDASDIPRKAREACAPEECPRPRITRKPLNYLTRLISDLAMERFEQGHNQVRFAEEGVRGTDRAVGTYLAGAMVRRFDGTGDRLAILRLGASTPGNGLCAFMTSNLDVVVEGGSQDGAGKGAAGGLLAVMKGRNILGEPVDGSTGKSFAYGAIGGHLMVQNMADSRACIRMSGADVVFGARITGPLRDGEGNLASRSHLKGFAFEYMTGGRVVVLGDPGPWICAGMTGGVIYQCLYPEFGFDEKALRRRLARGAHVNLKPVTEEGLLDIEGLLGPYIRELEQGLQSEEALKVAALLNEARQRFIMIVPRPLRTVSAE